MNTLDSASPVARYADLDGAGVLVTGGANGIGAAIVQAFRAQVPMSFFAMSMPPLGRPWPRKLAQRFTASISCANARLFNG